MVKPVLNLIILLSSSIFTTCLIVQCCYTQRDLALKQLKAAGCTNISVTGKYFTCTDGAGRVRFGRFCASGVCLEPINDD